MSNHVIEWLNAYHDGELRGLRLHQVEEHLAECDACRMELDSLQGLSLILRSDPAPELTERFTSNVNLLLPQKRSTPPQRSQFEAGWWMIPVGLLAAWIFVSTAAVLSNVMSAADTLGMLDNTTAAWISSSTESPQVTAALGQVGVLKDNNLEWAAKSESYTRSILPSLILQAAIAFLYATWIAVWWARRTHQERSLLLEG